MAKFGVADELNPSLTLCVFASIHDGPNFRRGPTRGSGGGAAAARWGEDVGSRDPGDLGVARWWGNVCLAVVISACNAHRASLSCGQGRSGRLFA